MPVTLGFIDGGMLLVLAVAVAVGFLIGYAVGKAHKDDPPLE